jgi:hypothetical protein
MALAGQAGKLRELANLVRARQREQAAAVYALAYGASPQDALRLVDQLMQGGSTVITSSAPGNVDIINISTAAGAYSVNAAPVIPASPYVYPSAVYAASAANAANAANASRSWLWYFGCLFAFIVGITIITTIVPLIGVLGGLWFAFK